MSERPLEAGYIVACSAEEGALAYRYLRSDHDPVDGVEIDARRDGNVIAHL
ncbi:hypothetical protein AB9F26_11375 [Falsihalocynthiibacter sp. BN13B15]|uniref:hypothetical protein n=1 Tax=Falsihalocynthiibacter sp. BN13B15 TaxID=3240871 RepID=UPI003510A6FA